MQTLSNNREREILEGIKEAVDLVDNQDMSPNDAIEKVARDGKWGADMIKFASYAYNTVRQTAQREANTNILDKFASFPLADPDQIIASVWPEEVKSAVEIEQGTGVSEEYGHGPAWLAHKQYEQHKAASAANDFRLVDAPPVPYDPDPAEKMARAFNQHLDHKRAAEEARHQHAMSHELTIAAMADVAEYFKKSAMDRLPFHVVDHAATVYYGPRGSRLMDYVHTRNRSKEARAADMPVPTCPIDRTAEPFLSIERAIKQGQETGRLKTAADDAVKAASLHADENLSPFEPTPPQPAAGPWSLISNQPKQANATSRMGAAIAKKAAGWGPAIAVTGTNQLLNKALSPIGDKQKRQEAVEDQWLELEDPAHDAELRKIRAQALISDLMNDDVISGYDPDQVLTAYNEISEMAPRTSMQPVAMRSLLRRHLQGNVEPFESKEITDIEKGLTGTDQSTPRTSLLGNAPQSILA